MEYKRISIDTSKHMFTLHGIDEQDRVILRRELRHRRVEVSFARLPPADATLEACAGAHHHWAQALGIMGTSRQQGLW